MVVWPEEEGDGDTVITEGSTVEEGAGIENVPMQTFSAHPTSTTCF